MALPRIKALTLPLLALLVLVGCNPGESRLRAVGQEGTVLVVVDSTHWKGEVGEALRNTLGGSIPTLPVPEPNFDLRQMQIQSQQAFDQIMTHKNVLFAAPLNDSTAEANFFRARLSEAVQDTIQEGYDLYVERPDLWRRDQMVIYAASASPDSLAATIRRHGAEMISAFNDVTRERVVDEMFEKGRQREVEQQLIEEHDFAINVQHDYVIAIDTMQTIWMRRLVSSYSWRSLLVHYWEDADPAQLSPSWIKQKQDSLTRRYMQGEQAGFARIDYRRPLEVEQADFLGRYAYEMRGLWYMVQEREPGSYEMVSAMGGPFVTYAFYERQQNRIYLMMGSVFAPKFDKREFLRQMEVIAHTFRVPQSGAEPQTAEAAR